MSDLKYQSIEELELSKSETESYIAKLKTQLAGNEERLKWINKYIYEKTPKEMTFEDIELALGHKVIIK